MSFNYPSISGNGLPSMLPLLTNMANGNNFISTLAASQAMSTPGLLATHHQSLSDSPLEFNNAKKVQVQSGSVTIDIDDRDSHFPSTDTELSASNLRKISESRELPNTLSDAKEKNFSMNQCDLMFNGVIGMSSPNLMPMMPSVMNMMSPSSVMSMQSLPQFSLLNHMQSIQQTSNSNLADPAISTTPTAATAVATKETITCKSCVLLPPNPNAPAPTTRERPPGCRTVFVGGLPENITEDIIREVFERCGEITTLRLSKKNFCHIRFVFEASVDSAIYLSGYRIRISNLADSPNCGRLHVDYAQARDDQYEWECKQRQLQREQRHRERIERDRLRPFSPPPVVHFTDHEAAAVSEKLKQDETFSKAMQVLITWLERGDCSKKNSNIFYSMIQSTNSHVRRLLNEKNTYEEELQKAKELHKKQMQSLSVQFAQINKVFGAASHKKVWDHFTKAQRKNIDLWKRQATDINVSTDVDDCHDTDEMEMSDDDVEMPRYGKRFRNDTKENESLKSDSMAYANNVSHNKTIPEPHSDMKDQQMKVLQETIRNLQTQLLDNKVKEKESLARIIALESKLKQASVKELLLKTKIVEVSKGSASASTRCSDIEDSEQEIVCVEDDDDNDRVICDSEPVITVASPPATKSSEPTSVKPIGVDEAQLISLISTFLVVHPFGASLDYIYSYVQQTAIRLQAKELEEILCRYTSIFRAEIIADGAKVERKWKFCGFERSADQNIENSSSDWKTQPSSVTSSKVD